MATEQVIAAFFPQYPKPDVLWLHRQLTGRKKDKIILIYLVARWCQVKVS